MFHSLQEGWTFGAPNSMEKYQCCLRLISCITNKIISIKFDECLFEIIFSDICLRNGCDELNQLMFCEVASVTVLK